MNVLDYICIFLTLIFFIPGVYFFYVSFSTMTQIFPSLFSLLYGCLFIVIAACILTIWLEYRIARV
ncbi:MAG: hypothetical protein QXX41_08310 [Nitrososphaerota archaeon]